MKSPRPSTLAWSGIAVGVAAYDYLCPQGEQLSERCDEWIEHPINKFLMIGTIGAVALHLTNTIPAKYDALHYLGSFRLSS